MATAEPFKFMLNVDCFEADLINLESKPIRDSGVVLKNRDA
jgi:hypothetical protein